MTRFICSRFFLGGVFLVLGALCIYEAYTAEIIFSTDALGAMDYPKVLLFSWVALTITYIVIPRPRFDPKELMVAGPVLIKTVVNSTLFVILLPRIGFICSSFLFVSILFYHLGDRSYRKICVISIASVIGLWVIFEFALRTPLPLGFWEEILHSSS